MSRTVRKYPFEMMDYIEFELPKGTYALRFDKKEDEAPALWALVDTKETETEIQKFRLTGTGHIITEDHEIIYINSFFTHLGRGVWHAFRIV